jgi:hypothetical protein
LIETSFSFFLVWCLASLFNIERTLTALPDVAKTDVTLNAVADKGPVETKLIAGLGVDTGTWIELGGDAACKL